MKNTLETRLGLFFALALLAAILIVQMVGGLDFFKDGLIVKARFEQVQELKEGDPVKMAGVPIGTVQRVALTDGQVEVTLKLTKPDLVKTDSVASISFMGLLGQNYVSVTFGSQTAPPVTENSILKTEEQADLATIMNKLEDVASGVANLTQTFQGGGDLGNMFAPLSDFLRENSPKLSATLGSFQIISSNIVSGQGTVGRLINEDTLYVTTLSTVTNFNKTASNIDAAIGDAQALLNNIQEGEGTLGKLATDDSLYTETSAAMANLREIFQKINQGEGSAGKLINDPTLFNNAKLALQKVEKATEGLEDQGPLSVMGILVNGLF